MMRSIRARLLALLVPGLVLVILAAGLSGYLSARNQLNRIFDTELAESAWVLMLWTLAEPREGDEVVPENMERELASLFPFLRGITLGEEGPGTGAGVAFRYERELAYALQRPGRVPLLVSDGAPAWLGERREPGYARVTRGERHWHVFTIREGEPPATVSVAERDDVRRRIVALMLVRPLLWWLLVVPLVAAVVWLAVQGGLRPLRAVTESIRSRGATELDPVDVSPPREVAPLTDALNDLLGRLRNLLEQERRFNAEAAHELRTPLASIRLQAESAMATTGDDSARKALADVVAGSVKAERVLRQLLTLARIGTAEAEGFSPSDVGLGPLLRDVLADLAPLAMEREVELELDAPELRVFADPVSLQVLVRNLVENALLYGNAGGRVQVSCRREDDRVRLSVADDGPGISPERRRRLLEPFQRGDTSGRSGSGLGLAIARRVAESHGSTLGLSEGLGGSGLAVSVTLPAA